MKLAIIGCTGSVGNSVMDVCRSYRDKFEVVALAANKNYEGISSLAREFRPSYVILSDDKAASMVRDLPPESQLLAGIDNIQSICSSELVDHVVFASSGTDAIKTLKEVLEKDKDVSLANKESIVVAGNWILPSVKRDDQIRPLDSEHNAIWQCLIGEDKNNISEIALTASGGPFREMEISKFSSITPEMAVNHPVWSMGKKISVDSATLINKGIEIIEAVRLFDLPHETVKAYIHPGSSVHGMIKFTDSTVKMLLSPPDMRLSALTALAYPDRLSSAPLDIKPLEIDGASLDFKEPDVARYPGYYLARDVAKEGGSYPTVLIGADEIAVEFFLKGAIGFSDIWKAIAQTLDEYDGRAAVSLEEELSILAESKRKTTIICQGGL